MTVEEKNKYINHLKKVNSKYDEIRYEINQTLVKYFSKIYINHQHIKFNVSNKVLEKIIFEPDFDNIDFDSLEKDYYPKIFTSKISLSALLSCLDLTGINFDNVKLSGICFSNVKGVKINLDKVWDKNLENSIFEGVEFVGSFNKFKIKNTTFSSCIGVNINPQYIHGKNFTGCSFKKSNFTGPFDGCKLENTCFYDCTGVVINIETLYNKCAKNCHFKGVTFVGIDDFNFFDCEYNNDKKSLTDEINNLRNQLYIINNSDLSK